MATLKKPRGKSTLAAAFSDDDSALDRETESQRAREAEIQRTRDAENQRNRGDRDTHDTDDAEEIPHLAACVRTLQDAASLAIENGGYGDDCFKLARAVKAWEVTNRQRLPKKELPAAFNVWWQLATKQQVFDEDAEYEEYLYLFLDAYEKTRTPLGANVMEAATIGMGTTQPPPEANRYTSPKLKRLVHLCFCLQNSVRDAPFFISVRDAARIIGVESHQTAGAFLNGLVRDGVLTLVTKGNGQRASRFRYNVKK